MKADDTTSHTQRDSHEHDRRRLHFTPYLYMRYVTEDDGTRPLPPDVAFWNSVDIDFFPKFNNNAMAGTPITVTATIWNQGYLPAVGVRVDFFWFQPGTVFQDRDSNRINQSLHLETVPAQSCKTVYCPTPWIPTYLGDGHECLVVQCSSSLEGKDSLRIPFHPELDRHVAQRNLMVSPAGSIAFLDLKLLNAFNSATRFALRMSSARVTAKTDGLRPELREQLMAAVAGARLGGPHNPLERELHLRVEDTTYLDQGVRITGTSDETMRDSVLALDTYLRERRLAAERGAYRTLGELEMAPHESRTVRIAIDAIDVEPGTFQVLKFSQVAENCVVGGYTIVIPGKQDQQN